MNTWLWARSFLERLLRCQALTTQLLGWSSSLFGSAESGVLLAKVFWEGKSSTAVLAFNKDFKVRAGCPGKQIGVLQELTYCQHSIYGTCGAAARLCIAYQSSCVGPRH